MHGHSHHLTIRIAWPFASLVHSHRLAIRVDGSARMCGPRPKTTRTAAVAQKIRRGLRSPARPDLTPEISPIPYSQSQFSISSISRAGWSHTATSLFPARVGVTPRPLYFPRGLESHCDLSISRAGWSHTATSLFPARVGVPPD